MHDEKKQKRLYSSCFVIQRRRNKFSRP